MDFDTAAARRGTNSVKWNHLGTRFSRDELLGLLEPMYGR